jgi:hypothetical protein
MKKKILSLGLLAALAAAGCVDKTGESQPVEPAGPPVETSLGIPENLITDGLKWMGYPFEKKVTYKVTGFPVGSSSEQVVVPTFDPGKNQLTFSYSGQPSMSSETYELRADGVYGVSLGGDSLEPPLKALPAKITEGDTWATVGSLKQVNPVKIDTTIKISGRERVAVPAGEFDALVIVETGTIAIEGGTIKVSGKGWYVEGVGAVKRIVDQTDPAGKASNITIEAIKIE